MASLHPTKRAMNTQAWGQASVPAGRNKSKPSTRVKTRECAITFSSTMPPLRGSRPQAGANGRHWRLENAAVSTIWTVDRTYVRIGQLAGAIVTLSGRNKPQQKVRRCEAPTHIAVDQGYSGGGTVTITSSVAIVNDTTWSTIVGTWRPGRLELYVDGWSVPPVRPPPQTPAPCLASTAGAEASRRRRTSTATSR